MSTSARLQNELWKIALIKNFFFSSVKAQKSWVPHDVKKITDIQLIAIFRKTFNYNRNFKSKTWIRAYFATLTYRSFSLNFGVRAGNQEDYDWIEQQMYDGDDFQTFATALSWMTDTEASIPIVERVRWEFKPYYSLEFYYFISPTYILREIAPDQFAFTIKEFGRQYLQRDVMLNWMIENSDVIFNEYHDDIPTIMTTMCAYIQTNADKVLIDQFEASLHQ